MSLNATYGLDSSYDQQDNSQEAEFTDDVVNLAAQGLEEGYQHEGEEEYAEEYGQDNNAEMCEEQIDDGGDGYQDEVLDIHINEPLDGEFQVSSQVCLPPFKPPLPCTHTEALAIIPHPFVFQR